MCPRSREAETKCEPTAFIPPPTPLHQPPGDSWGPHIRVVKAHSPGRLQSTLKVYAPHYESSEQEEKWTELKREADRSPGPVRASTPISNRQATTRRNLNTTTSHRPAWHAQNRPPNARTHSSSTAREPLPKQTSPGPGDRNQSVILPSSSWTKRKVKHGTGKSHPWQSHF